ncbi:ferrous iron transport protein B [Intestinibacillus sp. Marseille-P6563]|uniref:ferrous iron transport protein B n=1 Tax=Intestinibacillus sp. Marseille-P6563 TaxID=2364792 RepID=UPI000F065CE7|nr:ferrous iron transport protein B [Intestinibacillus sp. Marseille-P6563]
MNLKIALAGNPNCGKTTMFNALTGNNQYVGNWPGVTVEKKEGKLKGHKDVIIQDLPGIYSLSPYTLEEVVARNYLIDEKPDAILNIVDASNLERNLYLTTQLIELGVPTVVALNMMDIVNKRGDQVDGAKLAKALGCKVMQTSALKGEGCKKAAEEAMAQASAGTRPIYCRFDDKLEDVLREISSLVEDVVDARSLRWFTIKLFERDEKVMERFHFSSDVSSHIESLIAQAEEDFDDDAESIITNARYACVSQMIQSSLKKKSNTRLSTSDRIDHIVTNRILALPIFAAVMWAVYYIAITTVGTFATEWTNDVLFGEIVPNAANSVLDAIGCAPWLHSLIVDGIIAGVGAVLGFVPQMLVLYVMLAILEDCGYMARVAFIMDRIFRRFGLSGKSFIPMMIGMGCGIPGVMASRTIEQDRDRRMTVMTTTFIPCGAKLPIIGLIAGAIFGNAGWVAWSAYFIGVAAIVISGIILKKTRMFAGEPAPFVLELPAYHAPTVVNVLRATWERGWSFIKKAGTIILLSTIVLWFLQTYGFENGTFTAVSEIDNCLLASIGNVIAPIFAPLGWGHWQAAVASITGLIAKENVIATFGQTYHFAGELAENGDEIWSLVARDFTAVSAYSFMVFNLLCAPCFAAMGAIKREMNNAKWTAFAISYQCVFAYTIALMINQFGLLFTGGGFSLGTVAAIAVLIAYLYLLFRKPQQASTETLRSVAAGARV